MMTMAALLHCNQLSHISISDDQSVFIVDKDELNFKGFDSYYTGVHNSKEHNPALSLFYDLLMRPYLLSFFSLPLYRYQEHLKSNSLTVSIYFNTYSSTVKSTHEKSKIITGFIHGINLTHEVSEPIPLSNAVAGCDLVFPTESIQDPFVHHLHECTLFTEENQYKLEQSNYSLNTANQSQFLWSAENSEKKSTKRIKINPINHDVVINTDDYIQFSGYISTCLKQFSKDITNSLEVDINTELPLNRNKVVKVNPQKDYQISNSIESRFHHLIAGTKPYEELNKSLLISLFDAFQITEDSTYNKWLKRISSIEQTPITSLLPNDARGSIANGTLTKIVFKSSHEDIDSIHIFIKILNHFLGLTCPINEIHRLEVQLISD